MEPDDLLPQPGEWLMYLGNKYNITEGQYYQIHSRDYSIQCSYFICIMDDFEHQVWLPLVEFSLLDE